MSDHSFEEYKKFIDDLVETANGSSSTIVSIQTGAYIYSQHPNSEQQRKEAAITSLSSKQKEVVMELLVREKFQAIKETLEFFELEKYKISYEGGVLDDKLFSAFKARLEGSAWLDKDAQAMLDSSPAPLEDAIPVLTLSLEEAIEALQTIPSMIDTGDVANWLEEEEARAQRLSPIVEALKQTTKSEYTIELVFSLLNAFGMDTTNGVYWQMVQLIEAYPHKQELYTYIQQATRKQHVGTRLWSCLILGRRRNKDDEPFLTERFLQDESMDVRSEALETIVQLAELYDLTYLIPVLEPFLHGEDKLFVFEVRDALNTLQKLGQTDGEK